MMDQQYIQSRQEQFRKQQLPELSCNGFCTHYVNNQWESLGPPQCIIELYPPNTVKLKSIAGKMFKEIELSPGGKLIKQNESSFIVQPNALHVFFGLKLLTDNGEEKTFFDMMSRMFEGHRPAPALHFKPDEKPSPPKPPLQNNFIAGGGAKRRTDQHPPKEIKKESKDREFELENTYENLSKAIRRGDVEKSKELVELLCEKKVHLTIYPLPEDDDDDDDGNADGNFDILVKITDQNMDNESTYSLSIDNPRKTEVLRLKQEMFNRFNYPLKSQRWIINKKLVDDKDNLYKRGITKNAQTVYLYLVSSHKEETKNLNFPQYEDLENIRRKEGENVHYPLSPGSPPVHYQQNHFQQNQMLTSQQFSLPYQQQQQNFQTFNPSTGYAYPGSQYQHGNPFKNESTAYVEMNLLNQQMFGNPVAGIGMRPPFIPYPRMPQIPPELPKRKERPPPPPNFEDEGWNCPQCTFKNLPTFPGCQQCSKERPEDYKVPEGYLLTDEEKGRLQREKDNERMLIEAEMKFKEVEARQAQENYIKVMAFAENKLLPNQETFECPICYTDIDKGDGVMLRECLHCVCRDCLTMHITQSEDAQVNCPENAGFPCPALITDLEVKELLPEEDFQKYLQRSLNMAEHNAANSFHCRTTNCKGWCVYEDDINEFRCPICGNDNCLTCKAQHPELTCKAYQEDLKIRAQNDEAAKKTQEMLNELVKRGDAMYCPKCNVILQKKSGCDWMRCTMCKTEICWATKGPRWGPNGKGDTSGGCKCGVDGQRCTPTCGNCH